MAERPSFRYVNELAGSFILLAGLMVIVVMVQAGRIHDWWRPGQRLVVRLPEAGSFGLTEGADVFVLGTKVGEVGAITILPTARMQAEVKIQRKFAPFIRSDAAAIIRQRFGLASDAYLEIATGTGPPLHGAPHVMQAEAESAPMETIQLAVEEIHGEMMQVMREVRGSIHALTLLFQHLLAPNSDVAQFLRRLNALTGRLERGEGSVGKLLATDTFERGLQQAVLNLNDAIAKLGPIFDEFGNATAHLTAVARDVRKTSDDLPRYTARFEASLVQLQAMMHDLKATTVQLPELTQSVQATSQNLPTLLLQSHETMHDLETWLEMLQRHWLLGGARQRPADTERLAPAEALP